MAIQNVNTRNEEVSELISKDPGWLIRKGVGLFFLILICCGFGTYFIQYPDIVNTNAIVVPVNSPKPLVLKTSGRLIRLFKKDGENAVKGNIIAFLESNASHDEVIRLSLLLDTLQLLADSNKIEDIQDAFIKSQNNFIHLGELQAYYRSFAESFLNFKNYLNKGFYLKKKAILQKDLSNDKKLSDILLLQKEFNQKDLSLTLQTHDAQATLNKDKVISDYDMRTEESKVIGKKLTIPQIDELLINNETQQDALIKEILELDNQVVQQKQTFIQALNTFKSSVEEWKAKYLVTSPIDGTVSFTGFLQENQQIQEGQVICFIVPENTLFFCEMNLPQINFGKIKIGQEVILKFQGFPYQEFGTVSGKINVIKNIPTDSGYLSKAELPAGLITNYGKQLVFTNGMRAQAEVITDNMRLSSRIFNGLLKLIKH
ncbi:MAG: HlyD family efflux transporter periplasmic adaptor subunit [Ferruginibacter sp.]